MKLINKNNLTNDTDRNNLLEQYRIYVESADKISDRRINVNTFFITLNSALITVMTVFFSNTLLLLLLAFLGIIFSTLWFLNLKNYKQINSCKFHLIQGIEKYLPVNIYKMEWKLLTKTNSNKKYIPVSKLEMFLPFIFIFSLIFGCRSIIAHFFLFFNAIYKIFTFFFY